jgi:hypothetical protein
MNKKGVELSMNVIIIAAIGLLVLVILAVLVINSGNKAQTGLQSCTAKGGVCKASCDNGVIDGVTPCTDGNQCCKLFVVNTDG